MQRHSDAIAAPRTPALLTLGTLRQAQLALAELVTPVASIDEVTLTRAAGRVLAQDLRGAPPAAACLVGAGTRLDARHLPLFAAGGRTLATVLTRPRVGVVALPGGAASAGWLAATLEGLGLQSFEAACRDPSPRRFLETLEMLLGGCDLVLAAGYLDPALCEAVGQAQARRGRSPGIETVSLRPLGALQAMQVGATPVIALPADLESAVVAFSALLTPLVRRLQGRTDVLPGIRAAELAARGRQDAPRWRPFPARLASPAMETRLRLEPCPQQDWAEALAAANGLAWHAAEFRATDRPTVAWLPFDGWTR